MLSLVSVLPVPPKHQKQPQTQTQTQNNQQLNRMISSWGFDSVSVQLCIMYTFSFPSGVRKCSAPRKPCSSLRRPLGPPIVLRVHAKQHRGHRSTTIGDTTAVAPKGIVCCDYGVKFCTRIKGTRFKQCGAMVPLVSILSNHG